MRAARLGVARWRVILAAIFVICALPLVFVSAKLWALVGMAAFVAGLALVRFRLCPGDVIATGDLRIDERGVTFANDLVVHRCTTRHDGVTDSVSL